MKPRRGRPVNPARGEEGYALVAAVASIAVFAAMSLAVLSATRVAITDVSAEQDQLQVGAAADAGVAMALSGLLARDVSDRWSIDGRARALSYGGARLAVRIEDERGKVPINLLDETLATKLVEAAGLRGDAMKIARDSLLDWTDEDQDVRPFGAEADYYRRAHLYPRNGPLQTLDELGDIRGFDAATVARIKTMATVDFGYSTFDPRYADPRAIAIMDPGGESGPAMIDRQRELAGQRVAIEIADAKEMRARPLTIAVDAALPDGARAQRRVIVELTGSEIRPYVIRSYQ